MVGWPISRAAGMIAKVCGASPETANAIRATVAGACAVFDPIGGAIGVAHAMAADEARKGSEEAKFVNRAMGVASWVVLAPCPDGELPDFDADVA